MAMPKEMRLFWSRRRMVFVAAAIAILIVVVVYARHHVETLGDRKAIANRLQVLATNVERVPSDNTSLDEIRAVLNGRWSFARTYACTVLGTLGTKARSAIPDLIDALNCGDGFVEREAARALGSVGVDDPRAVPPLIKKLAIEDNASAWFAAESLGEIGKPAMVAIPALEKAATASRATTPFSRDSMANAAKKALTKLRRFQGPRKAQINDNSDSNRTDESRPNNGDKSN